MENDEEHKGPSLRVQEEGCHSQQVRGRRGVGGGEGQRQSASHSLFVHEELGQRSSIRRHGGMLSSVGHLTLRHCRCQVYQERLYQEYTYSKAEGQLKQMEKVYTQQVNSKDLELTAMKGEVTSMKKVLEEYKKKYSEVSEKLMERNRQYQKLQGLYDSLRLRNIAVANHEACSSHEHSLMPQPGVFGFPLGNAVKFPSETLPMRSGEGDFRSMPFFSSSSPTIEPANSFFTFNSPRNELEQQHPAASRAFKVMRL
ncbi:E3 ubiquitin-protein ligase CCNB1IP1 isoform X2 [Lissotriton helveticus]